MIKIIKEIVIASHNEGKVKEIRSLLKPLGFKIYSAKKFKINEPLENGKTFSENSLIKSRNASIKSGIPAIADDSGLCIKVLSNQPGIYSARWATEDNYTHAFKLIKNKIALKGEKINGQPAFFTCCLALLFTPAKKHIFTVDLIKKLKCQILIILLFLAYTPNIQFYQKLL